MSDLGHHFRGAIRPDIRNFRELPQWVRDNKEKFADKRVVVTVFGGVRCEKFSGWMVVKDTRMSVSFMVVSRLTASDPQFKVNFGTARGRLDELHFR